MGLIYGITNLLNGKRYIGLTTYPLAKRWYEHRWSAGNSSVASNMSICRAMRKHGIGNFSCEEIFHVFNDNDLANFETLFINIFAPEYNQTGGGEITKGRAHSEQARKTRSEKMKKFYRDHPEQKERMAAVARSGVYTDERKRKLSLLATGRLHTEEIKYKMSKIAKANNSGSRFTDFRKNRSKPVVCLSDGKQFASAKAADMHYGFSAGAVCKVVSGKRKTIYSLIFVKQGEVAISQ